MVRTRRAGSLIFGDVIRMVTLQYGDLRTLHIMLSWFSKIQFTFSKLRTHECSFCGLKINGKVCLERNKIVFFTWERPQSEIFIVSAIIKGISKILNGGSSVHLFIYPDLSDSWIFTIHQRSQLHAGWPVLRSQSIWLAGNEIRKSTFLTNRTFNQALTSRCWAVTTFTD